MSNSISNAFSLPDDAVYYMLQIASQHGDNVVAKAAINSQFCEQINGLANKCLTELGVKLDSKQTGLENINLFANALLQQGSNPSILRTLNSELILKELAEQEEALLLFIPRIACHARLKIPQISSFQEAIQWLKDFQTEISQTKELQIYESTCAALPSQIASLQQLTHLTLTRCPNLKKLSPEIKHLKSMTSFNMSDCTDLTEIPSEIKYLKNLTILNVFNCTKLTKIPAEIGELKELTTLWLDKCPIRTLPADMSGLEKLEWLQMNYSRLESLPTSLAKLPNLKRIYIRHCHNIRTIPPELLKRPIEIRIYGCRLLTIPQVEDQQATISYG